MPTAETLGSKPAFTLGKTLSPSLEQTFDMSRQLASNGMRVAWYYALNRLLDRRASQLGAEPHYKPKRPVPSVRDLFTDLGQLLVADAMAVQAGLYPAMTGTADGPLTHAQRIQAMFADLPEALARRGSEDAATAKAAPGADDLPDYFTQDFHFQTGGYMTEESARLYDIQVETLFMGSASPMRRAVLRPIADALSGRDQRQCTLLDVACGTGQFLRQVRLAWPALRLTGLDLSKAYLGEARHQFEGLRPAELLTANAERMPLPDSSCDIVTCIYLFHELPPQVRRTVANEFARVLKPGGRLIFMDSLQMGDKPGWDGMLEAFPVRFHEPYYRHYTIDDLDRLFTDAGLAMRETTTPFMSKMMVREKM
jgi:ubiquinone/menaquinone biosynthesis C-methylase UbiE